MQEKDSAQHGLSGGIGLGSHRSISRFLAASVPGLRTPELEAGFLLPIRRASRIGWPGILGD